MASSTNVSSDGTADQPPAQQPPPYKEPNIQWLKHPSQRKLSAPVTKLLVNKQVPEALLCPICMDLNTPLVLHCGHSICDVCEQKITQKVCPLCKAPYTAANKNYALISILDTLEIRCRYGCGAQFPMNQEARLLLHSLRLLLFPLQCKVYSIIFFRYFCDFSTFVVCGWKWFLLIYFRFIGNINVNLQHVMLLFSPELVVIFNFPKDFPHLIYFSHV